MSVIHVECYERRGSFYQTVRLNTLTNINKTNNQLLLQIINQSSNQIIEHIKTTAYDVENLGTWLEQKKIKIKKISIRVVQILSRNPYCMGLKTRVSSISPYPLHSMFVSVVENVCDGELVIFIPLFSAFRSIVQPFP